MAKVEVVIRPSGLINGVEWPEPGETVDLPDDVAEEMTKAGHVKAVAKKAVAKKAAAEKVEKRPAPATGVETREAPVKKAAAEKTPDTSPGRKS